MDQIRRLNKEELHESFLLSEFAFQFELSAEAREERISWTDPDQVWGYFTDGQLAAKMTILDFETWLNGKAFAMGGIAGVATWPEFRRKGLVGQLLLNALKVMKEKGQTISFLHPFEFAFYRKFGWETYIEYKKYEIDKGKLPKFQAAEGSKIVRVSQNWELLNPIYEKYAMNYNGMLKRSEDWWLKRLFKFKQGTTGVYYDAQGEPRGYVFYQVKDKICTIHDFVALDEDARRGIWKFIADHDSMMEKVALQAPADDALPFLLSNPRIKQEVVPYFMGRIVEVEMFLKQYPFVPTSVSNKSFYLHITDAQAAWNNGVFELKVDGSGQAEVAKVEKPGDELSLLACDIQSLTALMLGYKSAMFLKRIGRLEGAEEEAARLDSLMPSRTTYLADFF